MGVYVYVCIYVYVCVFFVILDFRAMYRYNSLSTDIFIFVCQLIA